MSYIQGLRVQNLRTQNEQLRKDYERLRRHFMLAEDEACPYCKLVIKECRRLGEEMKGKK